MPGDDIEPKALNRATMRVELGSEEEARVVGGSLSVDDDDWVRTTVEGNVVKAVISSDSVEGLKRAGDDWLACLVAAMKGPRGGADDGIEEGEGKE